MNKKDGGRIFESINFRKRNLSLNNRRSVINQNNYKIKISSETMNPIQKTGNASNLLFFNQKNMSILTDKEKSGSESNQSQNNIDQFISVILNSFSTRTNKGFRSRSVSSTTNTKTSNFRKSCILGIGNIGNDTCTKELFQNQQPVPVLITLDTENYSTNKIFELTDWSLIQKQNNQQKQNNEFFIHEKYNLPAKCTSSNENVYKESSSIGVGTDLTGESFKQFLKFKITQTEKYNQLNKIFKFITDLSHQQTRNFIQRQHSIHEKQNNGEETQRGRQFSQLIDEIEESRKIFFHSFQKFVENFRKIEKQMIVRYQNQIKSVKNELEEIKGLLKSSRPHKNRQADKENSIQQKLQEIDQDLNNKQEKKLNNSKLSRPLKLQQNFQISNIFEKVSRSIEMVDAFQRVRREDSQKLKLWLLKDKRNLIESFNTFKEKDERKNSIIKYCINEVIRLPEMGLTIFGMNEKQNNSIENNDNELLKKIGVHLNSIPQFSQFFHQPMDHNTMDTQFSKLLSFKCLNCAYLKSKMRFIHAKNNELQPILRMLKILIKNQSKGILSSFQ